MARTALYPGSFDPLTNGHVEILQAAFGICDRLVVAVGVHASKTPLLAAEDRLALIGEAAGPWARQAGVELDVRGFDNLVVDFAREVGADILVRGLRDASDFDYEMRMAGTNAMLAPSLKTVFLPAGPATRHITATLVRQIASMGGDIAPFVPPAVAKLIGERSRR